MSDIDPQELINDLDDALREAGETVILRRIHGATGLPVEVTLLARLDDFVNTAQLAGDIIEKIQNFILSPTEINLAGWPGVHPNDPTGIDLRIPYTNDELVTHSGRLTVISGKGFYVQDILVRIEGRGRGE